MPSPKYPLTSLGQSANPFDEGSHLTTIFIASDILRAIVRAILRRAVS